MTDESKIPASVVVYVCPSCGTWAGSRAWGDLKAKENVRSSLRNLHTEPPEAWGQVVGNRGECQHCKQLGVSVQRIKVTYYSEQAVRRAVEQATGGEPPPASTVLLTRR